MTEISLIRSRSLGSYFHLLIAGGVLLLPYLLLLRGFSHVDPFVFSDLDYSEIRWALQNSFEQGLWSAVLSFVLGSLLVFGVWKFKDNHKTIISLLIIPSILPSLFIALIFFWWMSPFPIGSIGVILIQGSMNAGLVAAFFHKLFLEKNSLLQISYLFGASRLQMLRQFLKACADRILVLFLTIFFFCFSSFAIPILAGGNRGTNLEVLIFEKLKLSAQSQEAFLLCVLQLILFLPYFFIVRSVNRNEGIGLNISNQTENAFKHYSSGFGFFLVISYILFFLAPVTLIAVGVLPSLSKVEGLWQNIFELFFYTLSVGLFSGVLTFVISIVFCYGYPLLILPRLTKIWVNPSLALVGFSFWYFQGHAVFLIYVFAVALYFFIPAFRLSTVSTLDSLTKQIQMANLLGANSNLIFRKIILPQVWPSLCLTSGLVTVWGLGEFSLAKILLPQTTTWAQLVEDLLSSYRIDQALAVSLLILVLSALFAFAYWGISRVYR